MQFRAGALASLLILAAPAAIAADNASPPATAAKAQKAEKLVPLPPVNLPFTKFVLKNGLTLIVHEDHKAPIVGVNVWYHVGSKNEPEGRTGFAHLFEHLMFGGKNGNQKGWFEKMEAIGATDLNGTTNTDRTNFFETVPTAALDMTLYLEAQRMGHLLDDFNESVLTTQRGVVQNEKRQGDNRPYAVSRDIITKAVWPAAHPYAHTVIGEMADLDAAKPEDVKDWFAKYYGPSNAVISIAGDITPEEAKAKVEKFFGAIPPGQPVSRQKAWIAKRQGEQRAEAQDRVTQARLYMVWNVPGSVEADNDYLAVLSSILDWGKDSRLYKRLVYTDKMATSVSAGLDSREIASLFTITVDAKPGADLAAVEKAVKEELGLLLKDGPTAAETERVKTRMLSSFIRGLERMGGFGGVSDIGADSQTYYGTPDGWKTGWDRVRKATPAELKAAGKRWLSDGAFILSVTPFTGQASNQPAVKEMPEPGAIKAPIFPKLERATLPNGLNVVVAERHGIPTVEFELMVDAGTTANAGGKRGVPGLAASGLTDGTAKLDALALSNRMGDLGIGLGAHAGRDFAKVEMTTFTTRLDPALDLFADVVLHPAYRTEDVERAKSQAIAAIKRSKDNPSNIASRLLPGLVFGHEHAFARQSREADIVALTPEDLKKFHDTWYQPKGATLIVVGDTTLKEILPKIEARFGAWKPVETPPKKISEIKAHEQPAIYLVDKPGTPQSVVLAAKVAPPRNNPEDVAIRAFNVTLGGTFTSRLNMNLREGKHWAYGARSGVDWFRGPGIFVASASVQTDKTAESLAEIRKELNEIITTRPVSAEEAALAQDDMTRSLAGRWETTGAVANSVSDIVAYGLGDAYYSDYAARVRALTPADITKAGNTLLKSGQFIYIVVGDRAKIEPGLKATGLEVRVIDPEGKPVP